jgi:hypothetical protein
VIICLIGVEINVSLASRMATAAVFDRLSQIIPLIDGLSDVVVVFRGNSFDFNYSASAEIPTITLWQFLFVVILRISLWVFFFFFDTRRLIIQPSTGIC